MLSVALNTWNRETFGNIFKRKRILEKRLEGVRKRLATGVSQHYLELETALQKEWEDVLNQEQFLWF